MDWESIQQRLEAAVERGELTHEEAHAKHRDIREQRAGRDPHTTEHPAIEARIRAWAEAGKITAEAAEAKIAALKK